MFGVVSRKVVSESCSASGLCYSQVPATLLSLILLHPRTIRNCQSICPLMQPGNAVNTRPIRDVMPRLQPGGRVQMLSRLFSSDSGDLVDAVVPFMGESISDGTLATFLKQPGDRIRDVVEDPRRLLLDI